MNLFCIATKEQINLSSNSEARAEVIRKAMIEVSSTKKTLDAYVDSGCEDMIRFQCLLDDYVDACLKEREARSTR